MFTTAVFIRFFRRGFKADLLLTELTDLLPHIVARVGYSAAERSDVVAMLKALDLEELGVKRGEPGLRCDGHAP